VVFKQDIRIVIVVVWWNVRVEDVEAFSVEETDKLL
jgi:hypothetical protein